MTGYHGRFAPSPTGPLHFGSLVAAVASWLDARAAGGRWSVRIEDVDQPRTVPGAADDILRTLEAHGLTWDASIVWQSQRTARYSEILSRLRAEGHTYRCTCSRKEIADAGFTGPEGAVYPGTCRNRDWPWSLSGAERGRSPPGTVAFVDRVQGFIEQHVSTEIGDFVLQRRDLLHSYQLAVVVDDCDAGITDVVRGADLLLSTPRQIQIQRLLGWPTPRYLHIPVAAGPDGLKLSKQTLAPALDPLDAAGALRSALRFLGQPDAVDGGPAEIIAAATTSWNPGSIPRTRALGVTDRYGLPKSPTL